MFFLRRIPIFLIFSFIGAFDFFVVVMRLGSHTWVRRGVDGYGFVSRVEGRVGAYGEWMK